jgi:Fic-DOC domain mobile mystery protein B
MGLSPEYLQRQTPLDEDEKEGLLIPTIATKGELDEFEQQNIEAAILWTLTRTFRPEMVFTEDFVKTVHKKMYGEVWAWAGEFRKTNKNIGIDKWQVPTELHNLLEDAKYWVERSTYPPDEMAVRFKHRIVSIHCFPNGNGRHSRLIADILVDRIFQQPVFTWGAANLKGAEARIEYLKALKAADDGEMERLIKFARS